MVPDFALLDNLGIGLRTFFDKSIVYTAKNVYFRKVKSKS